ncbi:MAG: ECF transporter S component [Ruminococcaceae bacterium]|nr:ECF transporter S component [Oscillospiraceae bacterium]
MQKNITNKKRILNITFIALFAALCYIALIVFFFPFAQMYIHFGNLIVVTAALLIGGWQGGLAGAIGMGLYDLLNGHADSVPKTFLLKFLIGLTVGIVFTLLKKRNKFPTLPMLVSGIVSLLIATGLVIHTFIQNHAFVGKSAVLVPIFAVIGILCIVFAFEGIKLSHSYASATVAAVCGMLVNIVGETAWKTVQFNLAGSNLSAAFMGAVFAQGSTLINAGLAIIGGVALYFALEKPFKKMYK